MCSYNRVNGEFACEDSYLLTDVLKKDFNFKGLRCLRFVEAHCGELRSLCKATHPRICRCNKRSRSRKRRIG